MPNLRSLAILIIWQISLRCLGRQLWVTVDTHNRNMIRMIPTLYKDQLCDLRVTSKS